MKKQNMMVRVMFLLMVFLGFIALMEMSGCKKSDDSNASDTGNKYDGIWEGVIVVSGVQIGTVTFTVTNNTLSHINVSWVAYTRPKCSCPARTSHFGVSVPLERYNDSDPYPNFFKMDYRVENVLYIGGNGRFVSEAKLEGNIHLSSLGADTSYLDCVVYNIPYSASRK